MRSSDRNQRVTHHRESFPKIILALLRESGKVQTVKGIPPRQKPKKQPPFKMKTLDQKLNALKPGGTLVLGTATWAERSGDGKTLRFVRREGSAEIVFKSCRF